MGYCAGWIQCRCSIKISKEAHRRYAVSNSFTGYKQRGENNMAEMMNENVKQWIIKADNDITIAGKDLKTDNPVTDAICFHAQQAAEKYLKAYLVFKDIEPEKTHKIEKLVLACMAFDEAVEFKHNAEFTRRESEVFRYPNHKYIPDIEEA